MYCIASEYSMILGRCSEDELSEFEMRSVDVGRKKGRQRVKVDVRSASASASAHHGPRYALAFSYRHDVGGKHSRLQICTQLLQYHHPQVV